MNKPRSVRVAGRLLWGLFAAGLVLVIAGVLESSHLSDNLPVVEEKSTFLAEAQRSAVRMQDSASLAWQLGTFNMLGALVSWVLLARGWRWGRALILVFLIVAGFGQVLLMLQDGSVGVKPYTDMSHDMSQEELMNSLLVAPGYFLLLYPGESAGLILAVLIGWKLLQEETSEYFQRRRSTTSDRIWDASEILAKRRSGVS